VLIASLANESLTFCFFEDGGRTLSDDAHMRAAERLSHGALTPSSNGHDQAAIAAVFVISSSWRGLLSGAPTPESAGGSTPETTPTEFQPFPRLILVVVGLVWRWIAPLRLGRLPGDIVRRGGCSFLSPLTREPQINPAKPVPGTPWGAVHQAYVRHNAKRWPEQLEA
jgi:Protein of unknown function (DUF2905)